MNKIVRQIKFAISDFVEYKIRLSLLSVILVAILIVSSVVLNIIVNYEMGRIPAHFKYTKNHQLTRVEVYSEGGIVNSGEIQEYIFNFIQENEDVVLASVQVDDNGMLVFIGLGIFGEFYNVPKTQGEVSRVAYGKVDISEENKENYLIKEEPIQLISSFGRTIVIPMHTLVYIGEFNNLLELGLEQLSVEELLRNFIFVDASQDVIDNFINDINGMDNNLVLVLEDMNYELGKNLKNSLSLLFLMGIVILIGLVFVCTVIIKMVEYITDRKIREFTINLLSGANMRELCIRICSLSAIIVSISVIIAGITLALLQNFSISSFVLLQAVVLMMIIPMYPIKRLKKSDIYNDLRDDING